MSTLKKIRWFFKRHPILYKSRFWLLSRNVHADTLNLISYNDTNKKEDLPLIYEQINQKIFSNNRPLQDWETIQNLMVWLSNHTRVGPGISENSSKALEILVYGKGGVCSDLAQVFNNFCVLNDILVREWGSIFAPYNPSNGGHSFNEVYIKEWKKWILVDPSWGLVFYDVKRQPLSALEMFVLLRSGNPIDYASIIPEKQIDLAQVTKNYWHPDIAPFLICNYHNRTYDWFLSKTRPYLPVFIIHFLIYLLGRSYHYKFPLDDYKKILF